MTLKRIAQRRSQLSKLRENLNPFAKDPEEAHDELSQRMVVIRKLDEDIREIAEGSRDSVRNAKSYNRQRQYLNASSSITVFHQKMARIAAKLQTYVRSIDVDHKKYVLKGGDPEAKSNVLDYNPREIHEACVNFDAIVKEAIGLSDLYYGARDKLDVVNDVANNVLTQKGRGNWGIEKTFNSGFIKDVKAETNTLVLASERMFKVMLDSFSRLESGVSRRKPEIYKEGSRKFLDAYAVFHALYLKYDEKIIEPLRSQRDMDHDLMKDESGRAQVQNLQDARNVSPNTDRTGPPSGMPKAPISNPNTNMTPGRNFPLNNIPLMGLPGVSEQRKMDRELMRDESERAQVQNLRDNGPSTLPSRKPLSMPAPDTDRTGAPVMSEPDFSGYKGSPGASNAFNDIADEADAKYNALPPRKPTMLPNGKPAAGIAPPPLVPKKLVPPPLVPKRPSLELLPEEDDEDAPDTIPDTLRSPTQKVRSASSKRMSLMKKANDSSWYKLKERERQLLEEDESADADRRAGALRALNDISDEADTRHEMTPEGFALNDLHSPSPEDPDYIAPARDSFDIGDDDIDDMLDKAPDTIRTPHAHLPELSDDDLIEDEDVLKESNKSFIRNMTKLAADGNASGMIKTILAHSERIESIDPAGSARLLAVSGRMLEKKKT